MAQSSQTAYGRIRRLPVSLKRGEAMAVSGMSLKNDKLVYFLIADKRLKYQEGKSKIAYIGTTQNGINRFASSVAYRAPDVLGLHGVQSFSVRIVTCKPRQRVKTWTKLERAFLLEFRERFGEVPRCNSHGKAMKELDEFEYFSRSRLGGIIEDLS